MKSLDTLLLVFDTCNRRPLITAQPPKSGGAYALSVEEYQKLLKRQLDPFSLPLDEKFRVTCPKIQIVERYQKPVLTLDATAETLDDQETEDLPESPIRAAEERLEAIADTPAPQEPTSHQDSHNEGEDSSGWHYRPPINS
jgi:hypothetical protein